MQLFYITVTLSVYLMVAKMLQALDGQQVSLLPVSSKNPVTPSSSVLQQSSSSSQSTASKQLGINAGQILAIVVFTEPMNTICNCP